MEIPRYINLIHQVADWSNSDHFSKTTGFLSKKQQFFDKMFIMSFWVMIIAYVPCEKKSFAVIVLQLLPDQRVFYSRHRFTLN